MAAENQPRGTPLIGYGLVIVGVIFTVAGVVSERRGPALYVIGAAFIAVGIFTLVMVRRGGPSG